MPAARVCADRRGLDKHPRHMDQPTTLRPGEELDAAKLEPYLRAHLADGAAAGEGFAVAQFPGGFSNLTYSIALGARELVLRRPPFGANIKGGHDMAREHRILAGLARGYGKAPRPLLLCNDQSILGAPFYVMERVQGVILRRGASTGNDLGEATLKRTSAALIDTLADLHRLDYGALGLGDLGNPAGYVARQVSGWAKRYDAAQTDELPDMNWCAQWLASVQPPETNRHALIHNDFKYDNVMFDARDLTRVVAVLDWEMATIGEPLMDLGSMLAYWSQEGDAEVLRAFNISHLPGNLTRVQLVDRYAARTGADVGNLLFYYAFGLFKIGVIVQQLYARFKRGLTEDARFASLIDLERALAHHATLAIDAGKMS